MQIASRKALAMTVNKKFVALIKGLLRRDAPHALLVLRHKVAIMH
jgi:hypothetical protein